MDPDRYQMRDIKRNIATLERHSDRNMAEHARIRAAIKVLDERQEQLRLQLEVLLLPSEEEIDPESEVKRAVRRCTRDQN